MYKLKAGLSISSISGHGFIDGEYRYSVRPTLKDTIVKCLDAGLDTVDVGISGVYTATFLSQMIDEVVPVVKETGIKVSGIHFPFNSPWMDFATPYDNDRQEIVKFIIKMFDKLAPLNPDVFVFHPGGQGCTAKNKDKVFENLCKSAEELSLSTDKIVCFENMVRSNVVETVDQALALLENAPHLSWVLDVNHLLHDKPEDAILRIGSRIKHLHISDYDFIDERHFLPGDGLIDWMKVIGNLEKIGYNGVFNYEVSLSKRGYTIKDAKDNFDKLFNAYNALKK